MQPSANLQQRLKDLQSRHETIINTVEVQEHTLSVKVEDPRTESPFPVSNDPGKACMSVLPPRCGSSARASNGIFIKKCLNSLICENLWLILHAILALNFDFASDCNGKAA